MWWSAASLHAEGDGHADAGTVTLIDGNTAALFGSVVISEQTLATADFRPQTCP